MSGSESDLTHILYLSRSDMPFFQEASDFCETAKKGIEDINGLEAKYIKFFVLDKKTYSLQECFRVFSIFCSKFEAAIGVS
jgi:hypothetical protein